MPPHCDSMDGPVVEAARKAIDSGDVRSVLPFVPEEGEAEVTEAFEKVIKVRAHSPRKPRMWPTGTSSRRLLGSTGQEKALRSADSSRQDWDTDP